MKLFGAVLAALLCLAGAAHASVNVQTANYTITTADCGNVVQMGTGASGQIALTFPSTAGFPGSCETTIIDGDTTRWKSVLGLGGLSWLYPANGATRVAIAGSTWTALSPALRYRPAGNPIFYIDEANGNDANDCQASGSGACRTLTGAFAAACNSLDSGGYWPTLQGAAGQTYHTGLNLQSGGVSAVAGFVRQPFCVGFNQLTIDMAGSTVAVTDDNGITVRGLPIWIAIQNVTLTVTGHGSDVECYGGGATVEIVGNGVVFGQVPSPYAQISVTRRCRFVTRLGSILKFSGGGGFAVQSIIGGGAEIEVPVQFASSPVYTQAIYQSTDDSYVTFYGAPQSGTPQGSQWQIQKSGTIDTFAQTGSYIPATGYSANNYLPGTAPGYYAQGGGFFDNPGAPSPRTCGTGSSTSGTDRNGTVTLGTGAATSCSLNFTTLTPQICVASSNSDIAVGVTSTGPSGLVSGSTPGFIQFNYSSKPQSISWHCEASLY